MRTTPRTEDEAKRASSRTLPKPGWYPARITEAAEKQSRRGNPMIELQLLVRDANGDEWEPRDWLTDADLGAEKLRSAVVAVDALERYEAGDIAAEDFAGRDVQAQIIIEKRRGHPDRMVVNSYRPASSVVTLRAAG
jgi:hypothetical protein